MGGVHESDLAAAAVPESEPGVRRGVILFGGFLLSLMGGMSYAWGSFVVPLTQDWGWTAAQANLPFTVMIIVFAIAMIPAGWIQDTIGPRKVATWGAALFLIGYALSGLLRYIPHPGWLVFSYGLIVAAARQSSEADTPLRPRSRSLPVPPKRLLRHRPTNRLGASRTQCSASPWLGSGKRRRRPICHQGDTCERAHETAFRPAMDRHRDRDRRQRAQRGLAATRQGPRHP